MEKTDNSLKILMEEFKVEIGVWYLNDYGMVNDYLCWYILIVRVKSHLWEYIETYMQMYVHSMGYMRLVGRIDSWLQTSG